MHQLIERIKYRLFLIQRLGFSQVQVYQEAVKQAAVPGSPFRISIASLGADVLCRPKTTDIISFTQVFINGDYDCVRQLKDVTRILDLGANTGYASVYFAKHYPNAEIVAVEPDAGNLMVLSENVKGLAGRVRCVEAGIWNEDGDLIVDRSVGQENSFIVRPAQVGEKADIKAVTISTLLQEVGWLKVDLLKMDIEGAEQEVFSGDISLWINKVRWLAIEIHGPEARRTVEAALKDRVKSQAEVGELTIFEVK